MADTYDLAVYFMLLLGVCWPGKFLVGVTTLTEFMPAKARGKYIVSLLLLNIFFICFLPTYFQIINKEAETLICASIVLSLAAFCFVILFLPESPFFHY